MITTILQGGFLTTVQDGGRPGMRALGISSGGVCDAFAARVINATIGNREEAAVLEIALGGMRLELDEPRLVAWAGGNFAMRVQGAWLPPGRPALLSPGEQISFAYAQAGCRAWLAISGGIDTPPVLGSRSTDLQAGFGGFNGRALQAGDQLPLGKPTPAAERLAAAMKKSPIANWGAPTNWVSTAPRVPLLHVTRGAEWDRFTPEAHRRLLNEAWTATPDSNRMGIRLAGPSLSQRDEQMLSAGVAPGTVQVPPGGNPILLLADAQTIGGYPKLAHVITHDLPIAAQLRPGDAFRFHEVTLADSLAKLREREIDFARYKLGLKLQMP